MSLSRPTIRSFRLPALGLALASAVISLAAPAVAAPKGEAALPVDVRVEKLLRKMTLEEKVGQMCQPSDGALMTGPGGAIPIEAGIKRGEIGSVLNAVGLDRTRKLQKLAMESTRLHIPLIFGLDVIHGYKTVFPIPLGESCSWDLAAIERSAHIAATEASADGQHWTFAPMVDIARDPRWGRISEGAGEDVYLGSQIAQARVRGFQGKDLKAPDSVVACVKHFAAYGAVLAGREYNSVDLSPRAMQDTYLPTYHAAVQAGARTAMSAFNEYDGRPASTSHYLMTDVLRKQWGFKGFVVSDWAAIEETIPHGTSLDLKDAARQAVVAGLDMDMQSSAYSKHLVRLVREGKVPLRAVDDAVRNILRVKFEAGLFEHPYKGTDAKHRDAVTMTAGNLAAARDVARKSIVLLKNDHKTLPIAAGKTVAFVGPLVADKDDMLGSWSGQGLGKQCLTILDGLAKRNVKVLTAKGCNFDDQDRSGFDAAVKAAEGADVVVVALGEPALWSGEAASRANIGLPGVQSELLAKLKATGKPVVLVLMNGRPLTVEAETKTADAVLEAWHLGTEAGPAIDDVLFGDYNPAGRLVTTFPRTVGQVPLYYDHFNTGRPFNPKDHYTSHYMDVTNDPLFPFGFGLSYTHFSYSPLKLASGVLQPNGKLKVQVTVKNDGDRDGEEVAQLYIRDLVGSVNRPVRQLKGFQKVMIKKGASKTLTFQLTPRDLAFHRDGMRYGAEAGEFKVWVGPSSASGSEGHFRLTRDVDLVQ